MPLADRLTVALDAGPLIGPPTGIGRFTADLHHHLGERPDVTVLPYLLSFRAALPPGARRLRYPARVAIEAWSRGSWPTARRSLRGAQVVHGTNYVVPPTGLPTVVSVHDLTLFERPEMVAPVVRRFGAVIRRAVDAGAYVHTISHAVAGPAAALLNTERVRVVYPGPTFNPDQVAGTLPVELAGRPFVLALGTREPRKNLARLVDAFGAIQQRVPGLHLVLAGAPGTADAAIAAAIERCPSPAAVVLLGYVDDGVRAALLEHASLFAYPSLDEGFGLPLLEAMHYGVPIVASTAGAIPEIARDAALLVAPTDTAALSDALERVLRDGDLRSELTTSGRRRCREFSWTACADGMVELYREALLT